MPVATIRAATNGYESPHDASARCLGAFLFSAQSPGQGIGCVLPTEAAAGPLIGAEALTIVGLSRFRTPKGSIPMKLSRTVAYALQASLCLAEMRNPRPVSCNRLASDRGMPERFLLQILRDLTKQGILQSTRGGGGGFMLARAPTEVSLRDIIEAVDGPITGGLPVNISLPEPTDARVRSALETIAANVRSQLGEITLDVLLEAG